MINKTSLIIAIIVSLLVGGLVSGFVSVKLVGYNESEKTNNSDKIDKTEEDVTLSEEEALSLATELYETGKGVHVCGDIEVKENSVKEYDDFEYYEATNWLTLRDNFTSSAKVKGQLGDGNYYSIDDTVIEETGKYYAMECARGSNMSYRGTDLEVVSIKSDVMVFDANSKYCTDDEEYEDLDDDCETYIVSEPFIVEKENNAWKISRLVYPNN